MEVFVLWCNHRVRGAPGACIIKLITAVNYGFRNTQVFVQGILKGEESLYR
jgi:hypothetical protein